MGYESILKEGTMGYESKVYMVQKHDLGFEPYYEKIATFDLCKMGYDIYHGHTFRQLFTLPQDGHLFADDGDTILREDCYGDPVEGVQIDTLIEWLEEFCKHDSYPRARIFLDTLRSFKREFGEFGTELLCFHYGY